MFVYIMTINNWIYQAFRGNIQTTKAKENDTMRYIDKTGCSSAFEKGKDTDIRTLGNLTAEATAIAEKNGLGLLKTRQGCYRIIKKSGLGAYSDFLTTTAEVDSFFKNLKVHENTKY